MNTNKEIERQINNQLSENREATIEGVSKEMKDEISWTYAKNGFEVSTTHRDDGTYDLTVRKDSSVGSSNRQLSAQEQENIVEKETPDFAQNQVEVYETGTEYHLNADVKKLWEGASEAMKEELGSLPFETPSVESVLLFDGFTIAEAPLLRFEERSVEDELEFTYRLLEVAPEDGMVMNKEMGLCVALMRLALGESFMSVRDDYPEWEGVLAKPRKGTTTADLDFSDEEIRGLAQLLHDRGLVGELAVIVEDGEVRALEDIDPDIDIHGYLKRNYGEIERHSPTFEVRIDRPVTETRRLYHAFSGEDYTALLMVNPDTFFGCHEVTDRRTVASESPLFVTVMEAELKERYK